MSIIFRIFFIIISGLVFWFYGKWLHKTVRSRENDNAKFPSFINDHLIKENSSVSMSGLLFQIAAIGIWLTLFETLDLIDRDIWAFIVIYFGTFLLFILILITKWGRWFDS